ncbi:8-amino-7-oxononanoate synthase [Salmonella bongori]|nr:8-amino-7-oxononanoate synthase [Salmonella bongori]
MAQRWLCSESVADYLLQFARHLVYSTSMPPAQAQALSASLAVIRSDEGHERREKLARLVQRFRAGINASRFTLLHSPGAIQPLIVGDNSRALRLAEALRPTRMLGDGDSSADSACRYGAPAVNVNTGT